MPASNKLQPLIFATLPPIGSIESMGKMMKIRVAPFRPRLGHTYQKVMGVPYDAREQETPTSYFCHFALNWFPTKQGQSGKNKSCSNSSRDGAYLL